MKQEIYNFAVKIIKNSPTQEDAKINIENYCNYLEENFSFEDKNFISTIKNLLNFYKTNLPELENDYIYITNGCGEKVKHRAYKPKTKNISLQNYISSCTSKEREHC